MNRKYLCKICGHRMEYNGELPSDYVCSMCGVPRDLIEEVEEEVEANIEEEANRIAIAKENPSIARILEKCVDCGACKGVCQNVVGIRYSEKVVGNPACINCGQCILNCPTGALVPKYDYLEVKEALNNPEKCVIALTSPSVRVSLGEVFGLEAGTNVEGKMVSSLKALGFNYVFDTTFGADLTIMEEASELVERMKENKNLPQYTSCCPAWVKYTEIYHPEILSHLSTCKSPIGMQTAIIKTYFAKMKNIDPKKIVTVAITPCTAKKMEVRREELRSSGQYWNLDICDGDYVLTASELGLFLKEERIDFLSLEEMPYDDLLGRGSGAGVIFGNTGGVTEAAVRTAYYFLTGEMPSGKLLSYHEVRGLSGIKEASVKINDLEVHVAIVHGLTNLEKLLKNGVSKYHFIEVMNCRGGCIGGGGQPYSFYANQDEIRQKRMDGLYSLDEKSPIRSSHENPDIQKIYADFLEKPLSTISHQLLHTTYQNRSSLLHNLKEKNVINS